MSKTVTIGRRLIPLDHIALVEPFDPAAHPRMQSERALQARVVLMDRESLLTEESAAAFAAAHGFRALVEDGVATNPAVHFGVETFESAEGFRPTKPYRSRLLWRDLEGNTQSKLLLSAPEVVLAIVVKGEAEAASVKDGADAQAGRAAASGPGRRRSRRRAASPTPA